MDHEEQEPHLRRSSFARRAAAANAPGRDQSCSEDLTRIIAARRAWTVLMISALSMA